MGVIQDQADDLQQIKAQAIEQGYAQFNPQTGEWEWIILENE